MIVFASSITDPDAYTRFAEPGIRRAAENVAAADVALAPAELERIDAILPDGAYGARYPAPMMPVWE